MSLILDSVPNLDVYAHKALAELAETAERPSKAEVLAFVQESIFKETGGYLDYRALAEWFKKKGKDIFLTSETPGKVVLFPSARYMGFLNHIYNDTTRETDPGRMALVARLLGRDIPSHSKKKPRSDDGDLF